jgi:hypothetical protein
LRARLPEAPPQLNPNPSATDGGFMRPSESDPAQAGEK